MNQVKFVSSILMDYKESFLFIAHLKRVEQCVHSLESLHALYI